ncbi:MAG: hypothetical protein O7J95_11895 [Planctomycetota bacterium]|nr:hypothetical protein [Planctomycetota bacterium]
MRDEQETPLDETFELRANRYLDGELADEERRLFEEALSRGGEEQRFIDECRRVDRLAAGALAAAVGESRRGSPPQGASRSGRRSLAAAAVCLVGLVLWGVFRGGDDLAETASRVGPGETASRVGGSDPASPRPEAGSTVGLWTWPPLVRTDDGSHGTGAWEPFLDRALSTPVTAGASRGRAFSQWGMFTIFAEEKDELHLLEVEQEKTLIRPVSFDL